MCKEWESEYEGVFSPPYRGARDLLAIPFYIGVILMGAFAFTYSVCIAETAMYKRAKRWFAVLFWTALMAAGLCYQFRLEPSGEGVCAIALSAITWACMVFYASPGINRI